MESRGEITERILACLRGVAVGGGLGLAGSLAIAVLYADARYPARPLEYEWHIIAVFVSLVGGAIGGSVVGLVDGLMRQRGVGLRSILWGLIGAAIGSVVPMMLPKTSPEMTTYRGVAFALCCARRCDHWEYRLAPPPDTTFRVSREFSGRFWRVAAMQMAMMRRLVEVGSGTATGPDCCRCRGAFVLPKWARQRP